jgi:hypothetical protein
VIDKELKASNKEHRLEQMVNECVDTIYYLNDMLEEVDPLFADLLSSTFVQALGPVLFGSLIAEVHSAYHVSIHVAYYVLAQMCNIFKYSYLVDVIAECVLGKTISSSLNSIITGPPPVSPPVNVDFTLSEQVENKLQASIFSFLRCKDDNLVCLCLLVIQNIIKNKSVSKQLLHKMGLLLDASDSTESAPSFQIDSELLNILLHVYTTYPLFRFNAYNIVSNVIYALSCNLSTQALQEYEVLVRTACCTNIDRLQKLLESKEFSDAILDMFDEEWEIIRKADLNGKVNIYFHNILPVVNESLKLGLEHRKPNSDLELCRMLVRIFFLMRKLIFQINSEDPDVNPFVYARPGV